MYFLYSLLFSIACVLAAPYYGLLALVRPDIRRGLAERLGRLPRALRRDRRPTIWVHAVSVGEVRAARSILQGLKHEHADHRLVLSVTTPSGRRVAETEDLPVDGIFHMPLDLPGLAGTVLDDLDCRMFIPIETEIWPNLFAACGRRSTPAVMLNGRISDHSFKRYRRFRPFLIRVLRNLTFAGMQTWEDAERLTWMGMGVHRMEVTGSVKFDVEIPALPADHPAVRLLERHEGPVWMAASTWPGEEKPVLGAARRLQVDHPDLLLVLAPRRPEQFDELARTLESEDYVFARRSKLQGEPPGRPLQVFLLDSLGELAALYRHADIAFVGGTFVRVGGHNIIEPAACGVPVLFGPHISNIRQVARMLMNDGGAAQVLDAEGLEREVRRLLEDDDLRRTIGERALAVVKRNGGAVESSLRIVRHFLKQEGPGPRRLLPVRHEPGHGALPLEEHPEGS
jgi:3-deoxy-D-manno-octulosonic-acid transferase